MDESMCRVRYEQCRCDVENGARKEEKRETMPSDKRRPVPSRLSSRQERRRIHLLNMLYL